MDTHPQNNNTPLVYSKCSYISFIEKLIKNNPKEDPHSWFTKYQDKNYGVYYAANIIDTAFDNWISKGMKD